MPLKRIPTPTQDAGNWGTILNDHLAQTQNPLNGAFNSFDQFSARPTNLTADDAGRTYIYTQTGNWHEWSGSEWKVQNVNNKINIKDYGAIGDGITDDNNAIVASINEIVSKNGGGSVYIPTGNYKVTGNIKVPRTVKIIGAGKTVTKLTHSSDNICFNNSGFVDFDNASTEFKDFTLYHTYTNSPNAIGILCSSSGNDVNFTNIDVQGFNGGVGVELRNINGFWTESTHWHNVVMIENKIGIKLTVDSPVTLGRDETSFGYTDMKEVLLVVQTGQIGLYVGPRCYLYHSHLSIRGSQGPNSTLIKLKDCNAEKNYYEILSEGLAPNKNNILIELDNANMSGTGHIPNERNILTGTSRIYTSVGGFGGTVGIGNGDPQAQLDVVGKDGVIIGGYSHRGVLTLRSATAGANFTIQNAETNPNQPAGYVKIGWLTGSSTQDIPDSSTTMTITPFNNVGIQSINPVCALDIGSTDAIKVPIGTTTQRPTTATKGMIRFNDTTTKFEGYNGTIWVDLS